MKSLPLRVLAATMVAVLFISSVAEAQQRERRRGERGERRGGRFGRFGGQRGGEFNLLSLLRVEEVRKEIGLDETQEELLEGVEEEVRGDRPRQRFNFRDATEEEQQKFLAERRARAEKEAKAAKEMLATVLTKDQMIRLSQISIQQQGAGALTHPDVEKQLSITGEQKKGIEKAQQASSEELRSKMREIFRGGGENRDGSREERFEELREKLTALRAGAEKQVLALLTPDQQKQFEAMQGKKFEMPTRGFGRRGGRGRGQGRSGGGDRPRRSRRPESDL